MQLVVSLLSLRFSHVQKIYILLPLRKVHLFCESNFDRTKVWANNVVNFHHILLISYLKECVTHQLKKKRL